MTLRVSSSRICARALGAMLVAALFTAASIAGSMSAQAQREPASPQMQKPQPGSPQLQQRGAPRVEQRGSGPAQVQGQASVSTEARIALEPHGRWQQHSRWGEIWIPANRSRDWRPYTVGRWVHTEEWGWYWVEDQEEASWGWVTFHYGRWIDDDDLGWAWIPGEEWGPGFVQWRHGKEHVGWAPLPPDEIIVEYRERPRAWVFVGIRDFATAPRLARVILPPREHDGYIRETVVVNQTVVFSDRRYAVNPGLPVAFVAAAIGRPLRAYEVRPRVFAGTARIPGAIEVRAQDVRNRNFQAQTVVRETRTEIRPAAQAQAPQPLAAGEKGRLGDNPPRAAREGATTGQAPQQQPQPQQGQQQPQQGLQQQTPQQQQRGQQQQQKQQQGTEGRGAPDQPKQGQTEQPKQAPAERSGAQQRQQLQKQQPSTEGRGAQEQPKQEQLKQEQPKQAPAERRGVQQRQEQGTQGRGGAEPKREAPQGTQGRGGDKGPSQAAPQPRSQPSATEGRGGGGGANKSAPQQPRGGQGGGTDGRGGPGGR
jgi:hypothetical protein